MAGAPLDPPHPARAAERTMSDATMKVARRRVLMPSGRIAKPNIASASVRLVSELNLLLLLKLAMPASLTLSRLPS